MSIIPFIISFILSAFLHNFIQKFFIHFKKFDDFNHRSSHKTLATRTGGIAYLFQHLQSHFFIILMVLRFLTIHYLYNWYNVYYRCVC